MQTPPTEKESDSKSQKSIEGKKELWKDIPNGLLVEAVSRSSDDTRSELARNLRDAYNEKTGKELKTDAE